MSEMMTDAEIVAEFCTALKAHVDAAQQVETTLTKQTVANLFTAQKRVKALSEGALGAALGEIDRLTAERDAARAAVNTLVRKFEGVPEEFERMHARANRDGLYPNGTVYSMYAEKTAAALRAALGIESEASE